MGLVVQTNHSCVKLDVGQVCDIRCGAVVGKGAAGVAMDVRVLGHADGGFVTCGDTRVRMNSGVYGVVFFRPLWWEAGGRLECGLGEVGYVSPIRESRGW